MNMQHHPVTTMEQLNALDDDAILAGYRAGCKFTATDHTRADQAYWHGYFNAASDRGECIISPDQQELARVYVASKRAH